MSKKLKTGYSFGTFQGVFMPSVLTVLGVIMYLRLGWVLGNVGLSQTLIIVTIATAITFLTALSISELATNMKVGGGGAYYIISRSLGAEAGAAIGLPLFFAQALGVSFYIAGFSESLVDFFPNIPVTWIGVTTLIILTTLAFISADFALKIQFLIFTMILLSLGSFFFGDETFLVREPLIKDIPAKVSFWAAFAVFFPAVTGIEAGLAMSGDLKNTERSLPLGTLLAIGISYCVYLAIPIFLTHLKIPEETLLTNLFVMKDVAKWGKVVELGLWGAALSSALGALLGAPRTLQALSKDSIIPKWIGKGSGQNNDPRVATLFSFIIALAGILLGDLNVIAPILSMFFLTSYGLLNLSAAFEGILNNPSWRPKFSVHWLFSFVGFLGCIMVMLMINVGATFVAIIISGVVYYAMQRMSLNAYWGDMRYGIFMLLIRKAVYGLMKMKPHQKTWRPNILVMSGSPNKRWHLIQLADAISHGKGFLTVAAVVPEDIQDVQRLDGLADSMQSYLKERDVPGVVKVVSAASMLEGGKRLIQNYGFGPIFPNTILIGDSKHVHNSTEYASLVQLTVSQKRNMIIVKEQEEEGKTPEISSTPRIDLWWRQVGKNAGLMLALAYQLKTSPELRGSRLVIKTIVYDQEEMKHQEQQLHDFLHQENMEAEVKVMIGQPKDSFALIRENSADADLVFLGLRVPDPEETPESYSGYYQKLSQEVECLKTSVLVLASEEMDFKGIFQLRGK